jgi:hypothetical protein
MSDQTWDVNCHVCGFKLGSNKQHCGQGGSGGRKVKMPPCRWAHTDDKIVRKAFAVARAAAELEEQEQKQQQETMARYQRGEINFDEPDTTEPLPHNDPGNVCDYNSAEEGDGEQAAEPPTSGAAAKHPAEPPGDPPQAKKPKSGHTKWTSMTRTMLWKCIQQKDPFHASDKGATWQIVADCMQQSTADLHDTADGDLRVAANGKTLTVFYKRWKENFKDHEGDDKHSGCTGEKKAETADEKLKKDERLQLAACVELERSAEAAVDDRRASIKTHENLKNGIVNEFVINCAVKDEKVRPKVVKELASLLRQAKMRKMAFEEQHKGATYTYTQKDIENFGHWEKLKSQVQDMPDVDDLDDTVPAQKGGKALAKALQDVTAQSAAARASFTPISPAAFAEAFFAAKRAQILTLKQKLDRVDADMAEGVITPAEAEIYKKAIKDSHYSFASP